MIKAEVREENGGLHLEVEYEGFMHEIMAETTHIVNGIARQMEEREKGRGSAYLRGLRIGMLMGLFSEKPIEEKDAGPCPQGPEGELGVSGG